MDFINKITDYILSNERRFSAKFMLVVLTLGSLLFADYFFRFSDSYITNTKIKQIEQIETILRKDSLGVDAKIELVRIEKAVIQRRGFWDLVPSFASLTSLIQRTINSPNANTEINKNTKPIIETRSVWLHNLSSGWLFWILVAFSPFVILQKTTNMSAAFGIIIIDAFAISFAFLFAYLFAFIPVIGIPAVNYLLNAALCFGLFWVVAKIGQKAQVNV